MVDIGQASSSKSVATLLYMRTCLMSASPPQFLPETKVEYIIYWYAERTLLSLQSQVTWPSPVKVILSLAVCYTTGLRHRLSGGGHHAGQSVCTFCGKKSYLRHGTWHAGTCPGRRPTRCLVCPYRPEAVHPHRVVFDRL